LSRGDLFVISAPSGTGKTTLVKQLLERLPDLDFSVSYTTRPQRRGETEGVDYHFVDKATFEQMTRDNEFLEWATVHGESYGTSARLVDQSLAQGHDVLLDIDTQGAASIRRLRRDATLIFILPPSFDALRQRLQGRGLDGATEVDRRLRNARQEMEKYRDYDYLIVNDSVDQALARLEAVVLAHRSRVARTASACEGIENSFRGAGTL
jgi:guanylate kinase